MGFDGPLGEPGAAEGVEVTGFGDVAGQVIGQLPDAAYGPDVDSSLIADESLPEAEDALLGPEVAVDDGMKMRMPLLGVLVERDLDRVDSAEDVLLPFGSPTHRREAATEELDLMGQGPIAGSDGQGQEPGIIHAMDEFGDSGGELASTNYRAARADSRPASGFGEVVGCSMVDGDDDWVSAAQLELVGDS